MIHIATKIGWEEGGLYFVEKIGLSPDEPNAQGLTPINIAAINGRNHIIGLFFEKYQIPFRIKPGNISIMHYVARDAPLSTCQLLVEKLG